MKAVVAAVHFLFPGWASEAGIVATESGSPTARRARCLLPRLAILVALLACTAPACAGLPECGVYRDEVTKLHIDVLNAGEAVEYQLNPEGHPINRLPLLLGSQDGRAYAMPAELGGTPDATQFTLSKDGDHILFKHGPGRDFVRIRSQACRETTLPPAGSCRNRLGDCMERLRESHLPTSSFKAACDEGVAHACLRWVESLQLDAAGIAPDQRGRLPTKAALEVLVDPPALEENVLEQLPGICERHRSMQTCQAMGDVLWRGLRLREALTAWRTGCGKPNRLDLESLGCAGYRALEAKLGDHPQAVAATRLPCGLYRGDTWDLEFHTDGSATFNGGETHAARLEQGDIVFHLAPDISVRLRPLASGQLAGLNGILRQEVLDRDDANQCPRSQ